MKKLFIATVLFALFSAPAAHAQPRPKATREALLASLTKLTGLPALPASHPFMVRAGKAADHLLSALDAEGAVDRDEWAWRGWVWAYHESAFTPEALGDGGVSCGYLQVVNPGQWLKDATCDSIRKDGVAGFRAGLRVMKHLIDKCGSVRSGLTNYATGKECPAWTLPLVSKRMKLAGDT